MIGTAIVSLLRGASSEERLRWLQIESEEVALRFGELDSELPIAGEARCALERLRREWGDFLALILALAAAGPGTDER